MGCCGCGGKKADAFSPTKIVPDAAPFPAPAGMGLQSDADADEEAKRKAEAAKRAAEEAQRKEEQDALDGSWTTPQGMVTIAGLKITWSDGTTSLLRRQPGDQRYACLVAGVEKLAHYRDGQLFWDDDDVWVQQELQTVEKNNMCMADSESRRAQDFLYAEERTREAEQEAFQKAELESWDVNKLWREQAWRDRELLAMREAEAETTEFLIALQLNADGASREVRRMKQADREAARIRKREKAIIAAVEFRPAWDQMTKDFQQKTMVLTDGTPGYEDKCFEDLHAQAVTWWLLQEACVVSKYIVTSTKVGDAGGEAFAAALKYNESLVHLRLSFTQVGDVGAKALADALGNGRISEQNNSLTHLALVGTQVGDSGARDLGNALKRNTTLKILLLKFSQVGDSGTKALAAGMRENSSLEELTLARTEVGNQGAKALADALQHNSSLHTLVLSETNVSDVGADALASALNHNSSLRTLDLSYTKVGDAGAKALAVALTTNTSLKKLFLNESHVGAAGAQAFSKALNQKKPDNKLWLVDLKTAAGDLRAQQSWLQ